MSVTVIDKPKIDISPGLLNELENLVQEEGQVVLHFLFETEESSFIRIWPTTYLFDHHSGHTSEMIHIENISLFPTWTECSPYSKNYFSLFFSGLPKTCRLFDFIEYCNGAPGAFEVRNIARNSKDVYFLKIN